MIEYPRYVKEHGSFYFLDEPLRPGQRRIIFMTDAVAFAFDVSMEEGRALLLKHGDPVNVNRYANDYRKKLLAIGDDWSRQVAGAIRTVTFPADFDLDEINRCIQNTSYLSFVLREYWPEALEPSTPLVMQVLGDSITHGRGSTKG